MKSICLLSTNLTIEGNVVFYLARLLAGRGIKVKLIAPHGKGLKKSEVVQGVEIKRFKYFLPGLETLALGSGIPENLKRNPLNWLLVPFFMAGLMLSAFRGARSSELLHAHWLPAGIAALPAKWLLRKPVVLTLHGSDVRGKPGLLVEFFLKRFDAVTTGHDELFEIAKNMVPEKSFLIRNAIDFAALEGMPGKAEAKKILGLGSGKVVSFIGRLNDVKQPLVFVEAAGIAGKKLPGTKFLVVGEGPLKAKAKAMAGSNLAFAGRVDNVFDYLAASDCFAAISNIENAFSVSLVEAMLAEVCCIVTDAGTTSKFFSHRENCIMVPKENPKELANAVLKLLGDEKLSGKIAARGKELAERLGFSREKILNGWLSIYSKVVSK